MLVCLCILPHRGFRVASLTRIPFFVLPARACSMAPKFRASRHASASSSSRAPTPRVEKIAQVDVSMTLSNLPFGLNGSYVSESMSDTACHVWILDLNAAATKVYDGSVQWAEYLKCEHSLHPTVHRLLIGFARRFWRGRLRSCHRKTDSHLPAKPFRLLQ